jgi:DNA-directed RNA polymerase III subunit RPC6
MPPKVLTPLHQQILDACESKAIGVTDLELISFIPGLTAQQLQQPLNDLLSTCRLKISNFRDETRFVFVPIAEAARLQGLTVHDQMVLQHISESGNHGIWKRDIKMRTGLQTGALDKCLKTLEARQLVKSATSAQGARGKKKIYLVSAAAFEIFCAAAHDPFTFATSAFSPGNRRLGYGWVVVC